MVFEVSEERRRLARLMGADSAHDPRLSRPEAVVTGETDGFGADLQVEAAGSFAHTLPAMEASAALKGTILVIGRDAAHVTTFPEPLQVKGATVVFAKGNAGHGTYPNVLRMIAGGRIDPRAMLTAKYPFHEMDAALSASRARAHGKILVDVA
jgi:threonine dehydrogenase-like Zn-dependent dehydrogenase